MKYNIGNKVYIQQRYPEDPEKPFVERIITGLITSSKGETFYVLNEEVQVGKQYVIGNSKWETIDDWLDGRVEYVPADEIYLHLITDDVTSCTGNSGTKLSLETVDWEA